MLSLEWYRHDILTNNLRLEFFCGDLVEEIGDAEKASLWLENNFVPAFENAVLVFEEIKESEREEEIPKNEYRLFLTSMLWVDSEIIISGQYLAHKSGAELYLIALNVSKYLIDHQYNQLTCDCMVAAGMILSSSRAKEEKGDEMTDTEGPISCQAAEQLEAQNAHLRREVPESKRFHFHIKEGSFADRHPYIGFLIFTAFTLLVYLLSPIWLMISIVCARRQLRDAVAVYFWDICIPSSAVIELFRTALSGRKKPKKDAAV
jgi:hypothetical protein